MRCSDTEVPALPSQGERLAELSVVIVTCNSARHITRCLTSLWGDGHHPRSWEVIVVDNASTDGTADLVAERHPWVRLIRQPRNDGLAKASNAGIRASHGRHLLFVNPDLYLTPEGAQGMLDWLERHSDVGAVGCRLIGLDGELQPSCRTFPTPLIVIVRRSPLQRIWPTSLVARRHLMLEFDHRQAREVDWLLGACLMVRREALDGIGLFDEGFWLYCEDVDLCFRLWERAWKVVYVPTVAAQHAYARESARGRLNRTTLHHLRSMARYLWKHRQWTPIARVNPRLKTRAG